MTVDEERLEYLKNVVKEFPNISRDRLTRKAMETFNVERHRISHLVTSLDIYPKKKRKINAPPPTKDGFKVCANCLEEKELDEFPSKKRRKGKIEVYAYCKVCHNKYQKESALKRNFNLTLDERNKMGDVCMICGFIPKKRANAVDHDHKTGLIRGILCSRCNRGLTWFQDKPELFENAANYLKNPPATGVFGKERYTSKGSIDKKARRKKNKTLLDGNR